MSLDYSTNFEDNADFEVPPGWLPRWLVRTVGALGVTGPNVLTSPGSSGGITTEFTLFADQTTVEYTYYQVAGIDGSTLRVINPYHTNAIDGYDGAFQYRFLFTATTSSFTADLSPFWAGTFPGTVATGTRPMPVFANDVIGIKLRVDGKDVSLWVWNQTRETIPAQPLVAWTDSVQRPAGHFACGWPGYVLTGIDNFSISDGFAVGGGTSLPAAAVGAAIASGTADASLSSPAAGTVTISGIRDLTTGALRPNESGITVIFNHPTTGALVVLKTGQTTNAGADLVVSDPALVAATTYRVTTILADGSEGTWKYTAS